MDRSSVGLLVDGIKSMINFFTSVSFIHMKRNLNEAAHILAKGLFVWAVAGWLCRESCCVEKAAVQGKLLFQILVFGNLAGCLGVKR
jgi:hypothetical protein